MSKTNHAKPSDAAIARLQNADRAALIAVCGMEPEGAYPDDCYPSTTGEIAGWLREKGVNVEQTWHEGAKRDFCRLTIVAPKVATA